MLNLRCLRKKSNPPTVVWYLSSDGREVYIRREVCFDEFTCAFKNRGLNPTCPVEIEIRDCERVSRQACSGSIAEVDAPPIADLLLNCHSGISSAIVFGNVITISMVKGCTADYDLRRAVMSIIVLHQEQYRP